MTYRLVYTTGSALFDMQSNMPFTPTLPPGAEILYRSW